MILVVGGYASGKRSFVEGLGFEPVQMSGDPAQGASVLLDAHDLLRGIPDADPAALARELAGYEVVTCAEVGAGVVPVDPDERAFRESAGRLAVALADLASCVVRMSCGIPQVLKGKLPCARAITPDQASPKTFASGALADAPERGACAPRALADAPEHGVPASGASAPLVLTACAPEAPIQPAGDGCPAFLSIYRHGPTRLNRARKYLGRLDEPLDWVGEEAVREQGADPRVSCVYVSPLSRCRQTAKIMFPNACQVVVDSLQEMDFGEFDGFSYEELSADPRYQAWVDAGCKTACPQGEDQAGFAARVSGAIRTVIDDARTRGLAEAIIVAHAGTAMAAFWSLCERERDYFDWHIQAGKGLRAQVSVSCDGTIRLTEPEEVAPGKYSGR